MTTTLDKLKKYASTPLSDRDIMSALDGKTRIVLYRDLYNYPDIDDLLYPYDSCVILYETSPAKGHWTALIKIIDKKNTTIEFYDPYSNFPDTQQKYIPEPFLSQSGQNVPVLSYLLINCNPKYQISYNQHKFQKFAQDIQTCGRWCLLRIICKDMNLKDFSNFVFNSAKELGLSNDLFVSTMAF
jgi:hypothetical protein